jgi:hypothetical protein
MEGEGVPDYHHVYLDLYKPTPAGVVEILLAKASALVVIQLQVTDKAVIRRRLLRIREVAATAE